MPNQCEGFTKNGQRCKKTCPEGKTKCHIHLNDSCPICMNIMNENTSRTLECGHTFHTACIDRWRRRSHTCPNCRAPFDQQVYKVKITIDPLGYEHENITSNIQSIADMFGLDTSVERFFSTINFAVSNMTDLRNILHELGFPGVDFPSPHTES